jgi:heat shock protein HslJ
MNLGNFQRICADAARDDQREVRSGKQRRSAGMGSNEVARPCASAAMMVVLLVVTSCQRQSQPNPNREKLLEQCAREWQLERWMEDSRFVPLPSAARATLTCDGAGVVHGTSFVNHYSYAPPTDADALLGAGTQTLMASSPELMNAEDRFSGALLRVRHVWRAANGRLVLSTTDGKTQLEFVEER